MEKKRTRHSILFILLVLITISNQVITQNQSKSLDKNYLSSQSNSPNQYNNDQDKTSPLISKLSQNKPTKNHQTSQTNLNNNNKKRIHLFNSFNNLFKNQNSFWLISFKILKIIIKFIFLIFYYPISFLFNLLHLIIFWFCYQIIYPMTFPIRLSCWIFIIKPIQIVKIFLIKLKPLMIFVISGITIGVLIGIMGGLVHLFIANRLFPLHLKTKINLNKPLKHSDILPKESIDNHNTISQNQLLTPKYHHDKEEDQFNQKRDKVNNKKTHNPKNKKIIKVKENKIKSRKQDKIESDLSSLEEENFIDEDLSSSSSTSSAAEEEETSKAREVVARSQISELIKRNKNGYSSAIQSIINDQSRKRSPSSSSNFNIGFDSSNNTSPSISHLQMLSRLNVQSASFSSSSPSPSSHSIKNHPFSPPSNKKKVTFKID